MNAAALRGWFFAGSYFVLLFSELAGQKKPRNARG
jgi:hypothetical protein